MLCQPHSSLCDMEDSWQLTIRSSKSVTKPAIEAGNWQYHLQSGLAQEACSLVYVWWLLPAGHKAHSKWSLQAWMTQGNGRSYLLYLNSQC